MAKAQRTLVPNFTMTAPLNGLLAAHLVLITMELSK